MEIADRNYCLDCGEPNSRCLMRHCGRNEVSGFWPRCAIDRYDPTNAASSCPVCDDCIAQCVPHGCQTEPVAQCDIERPECPNEDFVSVVRDGCWRCVNRRECGNEPQPGACAEEGQRVAVIPNAPDCCPGLTRVGCERPSAETGGICVRGCVGATLCIKEGDGICAADKGEHDCNSADCR